MFLARHTLLNSKVVLKRGDKYDRNVLREIYFLREFKHPNIAKLVEIIITETHVYIVSEYCSEGELFDYLVKCGQIPLFECQKLFAQICGSVHYLHQLRCCHRDLKLENILLDRKMDAKLCDFGFTREFFSNGNNEEDDQRQNNALLKTVCGTDVCMAPEIVSLQSYSGVKIDIWALGVMLYTMVFGELPFDDPNAAQLKKKILVDEPDYTKNTGVPQGVVSLMKKMLAKDPEKRPSSLDEILRSPFLQPFGDQQLRILQKLKDQRYRPCTAFSSRLEKYLLRKLERLHVNTDALIEKYNSGERDSLVGMWVLLVDKEKRQQKLQKKLKSKSRQMLKIRGPSRSLISRNPSMDEGREVLKGLESQKSFETATPDDKCTSASSPKGKGKKLSEKLSVKFWLNKVKSAPVDDYAEAKTTNKFEAKKAKPQEPKIGEHPSFETPAKRPSKLLRPVSMVSNYSSYSQMTGVSDVSIGSEFSSSRPPFNRAHSSEFSVLSKFKDDKGDSSNSSTRDSRSNSLDSSRSNTFRHSRGRRGHPGASPFFAKRSKSPLNGPANQYGRRKKKSLNSNKKATSFIIEEEDSHEEKSLLSNGKAVKEEELNDDDSFEDIPK